LLTLYVVAYTLSYGLGRALYLEPALVSAMWPGNGLALGVLLAVDRRWWPVLFVLQGATHLVLGVLDISVVFAVGVTIANLVETGLAAWLIHRWCGGPVRLTEPAHVARLLGGALVGVVPGALIGALTVWAVYGNPDVLATGRLWLLSDLIGILVLAPAVIALRALPDEIRVARPGEVILAGLVLVLVAAAVGLHPPGLSDALLRPALIWIPLLWLGLRCGPASTSLGAAMATLVLLIGADLDRGPFVEAGRNAEELSLSVQVFVSVLCTGSLLIAASAAGHRLAMTAISAAAERLRTTLASIGDGVIATDGAGRVELMNPVASHLTGWSDAEARGRPLAEVFPITSSLTGETVANPVERVLRDGAVVGLANHTELTHRDGSKRQIADSGAPIRDHTGHIAGAVLVFRDVTERYRLEERLRQTEKLEAIGRLSSGIAHDLNNMLGGVMGGAELLQGRVGDDERLLKPVRMILAAAERMRELNARLLSFARREPAARRVFVLDKLVSECAELLRHGLESRYAIEVACTAGDALVLVDRGQFQSALLNLAVNARDAMPQGGRLMLRTGRRVQAGRDQVFIAVQDTGSGMTPQVRARVFEPFFTTKPAGLGTGLGLHAVQTCMRAHDGEIAIDTAVGVGTTVTLILPRVQGEQPDTPQPAAKPLRVLLVDDDPAVLGATSAQLEDLGFAVVAAEDGVGGLEALSGRGPFDVVVLDVVMPRLDGLEMLRVLRQSHPRLPVLLVSGRLPETDLDGLLALGPTALLAKPYRLADLRRALDEVRSVR
jgi:PAS domain S-box-containing protein